MQSFEICMSSAKLTNPLVPSLQGSGFRLSRVSPEMAARLGARQVISDRAPGGWRLLMGEAPLYTKGQHVLRVLEHVRKLVDLFWL